MLCRPLIERARQGLDRLLDGADIHLANTDPPYNVKVEPRSNNAIAAGLSSFSNDAAAQKLRAGQGNASFDVARGKAKVGNEHHQKFDLARHPEKSKATHRKMRAKDRPLANDFVSDDEFDRSRFNRRRRLTFAPGVEAPFAAPEDVIVRKLQYYAEGGSEKHLRDIRGILRTLGDSLDDEYLRQWIDRLHLRDQWESARTFRRE